MKNWATGMSGLPGTQRRNFLDQARQSRLGQKNAGIERLQVRPESDGVARAVGWLAGLDKSGEAKLLEVLEIELDDAQSSPLARDKVTKGRRFPPVLQSPPSRSERLHDGGLVVLAN